MNIISQIVSKMKDANVNNVAIIVHDNADADAIGSATALEKILQQLDKKVTFVAQTKINKNFAPIVGKNRVNKTNIPRQHFDIVFLLDCSEPGRANINYHKLSNFCIVIDHHANFTKYGNIYWCENVVATAVLIYKLYTYLKQDVQMTKEIATSLYLAIRGDTFNFRTVNTDSDTHAIVSELLKYDINLELVNETERYQESIFKLQQVVWENMLHDYNYKILYVLVTKDQIEQANSTFSEAAYIVDVMRLVKDVDVAVLFLRTKNNVYIKTRSNRVNVSQVMSQFGGGGHKTAAGALVYSDSVYSLMNSVIQKIREQIDMENKKKL